MYNKREVTLHFCTRSCIFVLVFLSDCRRKEKGHCLFERVMLCYVFQDDGQLLCYFTMEAAAETDAFLYTDVEDCRTQRRELFRIMTPDEQMQFLQFCRGKRYKRRFCCTLKNDSFVRYLERQNVAIYAERYERLAPSAGGDGLLFQWICRSILKQLNDRYDKVAVLTIALKQHIVSCEGATGAQILSYLPHVTAYLIACEEHLYEFGADYRFLRRCYLRDQDGFLGEEAINLPELLLFLAEQLPRLQLFSGICWQTTLQKTTDIRILCRTSTFVYLYVLLIYFLGTISRPNGTYVTVEHSREETYFCVSCFIYPVKQPFTKRNDLTPLIQMYPLWGNLLLMLQYLLKQQHIAYICQITENESRMQRMEICLYLPTVTTEKMVFRHKSDMDKLSRFLSQVELFLFLLHREKEKQDHPSLGNDA